MLVGLWCFALVFAFLMRSAFPSTRNCLIFQHHACRGRPPFNFVDLFIPSNPFHSLSNNIVPAVVLFFVFIGVALIGVERKQVALDVFTVAKEALAQATKFVVGLTPYGVFAIAAKHGGHVEPRPNRPDPGLLITYVVDRISSWLSGCCQGLVAALTPFSYREVLGPTRDALITAFMAADLFIVLPILIQACKDLLERHRLVDEPTRALPEVIMPTSFNFPHTGKLLSISFILFAGWFADAAVPLSEYPRLALAGLLTFFGSSQCRSAVPARPVPDPGRYVSAVPCHRRHQLEIRRAARGGPHGARWHCSEAAAIVGALRFSPARIGRYVVVTAGVTAVTIGGLRVAFRHRSSGKLCR